nr:sigma-70 family RNA polymerase sigma factor [Ktedonobacterales bacterium]
VRDLRAGYQLSAWEHEIQRDIQRVTELVEAGIERGGSDTWMGRQTLPEWIAAQARRVIEEGVVVELQRGSRLPVWHRCREILAEMVADAHRLYHLTLRAVDRRTQIERAVRLMDMSLASYPGTPAFHIWMTRLAHRENVARAGIVHLEDWLRLHARRAVEEYVVEEMRRNPDSHLFSLNVLFVARIVCRWHKVRWDPPAGPHTRWDWDVILQRVPSHLHDDIAEAEKRIFSGLPGFSFKSNFDTWRTTVVENTLKTRAKGEERIDDNELPLSSFSRSSDDPFDTEEREVMLPSQELSPEDQAAGAEALSVLEGYIELAIALEPETGAIIRMRLDGIKPREVAELLDVSPDDVYQAWHRFRRRMRELLASAG